MSEGLQNAGYIGLTQNVGKRENATRELNVLNQMVQQKESDDKKEQEAEAAEQAYYERLRLEADKLLEGDRSAINQKAFAVQGEIKRKIKMFGGSHAKFMENGGLSMIGDYSNQILNSKELGTYRANKENLTKLMALQEQGKGALITPRDLASLEDYQRDGKGVISYSGLMSEIEMPSKNAFDYGYDMTPTDIYAWGDNKTKLIANWMLEYPERGTPTDRDILTYITVKGYGGKGERAIPKASSSTAKSSASSKVPDTLHSWSSELFTVLSPDVEVPINELNENSFALTDYLKATIGNKKWNKRSSVDASPLESIAEGFSNIIDYPFGTNLNEMDNGYMLKNALQLPVGTEEALFRSVNANNYEIAGGVIKNFDPLNTASGGVYGADGEFIDANNGVNKDQYSSGDYKFMGAALAWKTDVDGSPHLVVDGVTEEGKLDPDRKAFSGEGNKMKARTVMVNMLMKDGMVVYQEIPHDTKLAQNALSEALGKVDDLADVLDENREKASNINAIKRKDVLQKASKPTLKVKDYDDVFDNNDLFKGQNTKYNLSNPEGNQRDYLRKSLYLAYKDLRQDKFDIDSSIEEDVFGKLMTYLDIDDSNLRNTKHKDEYIVEMIRQQMRSKAMGDQNTLDQADLIAVKMLAYLEEYKTPKSK